MRFSKRMRQILVAGVAGLGLIVGTAGPAAADGWEQADRVADSAWNNGRYKNCTGPAELTVCFQPYGDDFWLLDEKAEGRAIAVEWYLWRNNSLVRSGVIYNNHGADEGWTRKYKDFPEESGHLVEFRGCNVKSWEYHTLDNCGGWEYVYSNES